MGTTYFTLVVYGVPETAAMRKARNTTIRVEVPVCSKNSKKHRWHRWERNPPKFCPHCGGEVVRREVSEPYTENPPVAYAAPGLDPENNDRDYDTMINEWVHNYNEGGPVVLGVCILHKYSREDLGAFPIPEPTAEQKKAAEEYLAHLGVTETPQTYLVLGGH